MLIYLWHYAYKLLTGLGAFLQRFYYRNYIEQIQYVYKELPLTAIHRKYDLRHDI